MVAASSNRVAWVYHADNSVAYRVAAVKWLTDQDLCGGEAWTDEPAKPAAIKMRRITITTASAGSRVVPVYSTDAGVLVENAAINVNILGALVAGQSSGNPIPEGHLRKSVTTQSA